MTHASRLPPFLFLDLDDTILSYTDSGRQCWQLVAQEYAPRLELTAEQFLIVLDQTSDTYWSDPERHRLGRQDLRSSRREVLRLTFRRLGLSPSPLSDEIADAFTERREPMIIPFEGAIEALKAFQQQGIHMALLTNGNAEFQRPKIERFKLAQYFEVIMIESEFGVGKPDHSVFHYALEKMGAISESVWMVGDDLKRDILPAQQLGLGTVWVNHQHNSLPTDGSIRPGRIVEQLAELVGK
jgi:putative hydrolase of the HAD superfamily